MKKVLVGAGGLVLFLVGIAIGSAGTTDDDGGRATTFTVAGFTETELVAAPGEGIVPDFTATETVEVVRTVTQAVPEAEPAEEPAGTIPGDGIYMVGADVEPGTYRSSNGDDATCYWARLSGLDGAVESVIANSLGGGQSVVEIAAGDAAFETRFCGEWTKTG